MMEFEDEEGEDETNGLIDKEQVDASGLANARIH
jgi:hypothetical protein